MKEMPLGELTCLANDKIWDFWNSQNDLTDNYDQQEIDLLKEYLTQEKSFSVFKDELSKIILEKDPSLKTEETQLNYLVDQARKKEILLERNTLKNWLKGNINPQGNSASRDNMYKLCFLLDFDFERTWLFFSKVYLDRPFDFRNKKEAVYAFCFKNKKDYKTAMEIIEYIENIELYNTTKEYQTIRIGEDIGDFKETNSLIEFIQYNANIFEQNNISSVNQVKKLMKICMDIVNKKRGGNTHISVDDVLEEIYGDNLRGVMTEGKNNTIKKKSAFLNIVKMNFPQKQLYYAICNNKASYHVIRKFLIILHFYSMFSVYETGNDKGTGMDVPDYESYIDSVNDMLFECGYSSLYSRNPYDWMFMHCATNDYPLERFHQIMNVMFFDECFM